MVRIVKLPVAGVRNIHHDVIEHDAFASCASEDVHVRFMWFELGDNLLEFSERLLESQGGSPVICNSC